MSLEPDLNQRPKDICMKTIYSPPLYQLSYRGLDTNTVFIVILIGRRATYAASVYRERDKKLLTCTKRKLLFVRHDSGKQHRYNCYTRCKYGKRFA